MKPVFFLCCLVICCTEGFTQDSLNRKIERDELLFTGSHFSISVIPLFTQKATIQPFTGPYTLGSRVVRGIQAGFNYHNVLGDQFSLLLGLHGGASVRNYSLYIPKNDFSPAEPVHFIETTKSTETVDFYISAPVLFEKRWLVGRKGYWNAVLGSSLKFYPAQFSETIIHEKANNNGGYYEIIKLELEVGRNYTPWLDYNLGGGYTWRLKNGNLFGSNILINFSDKSISRGTYQIQIPGKPVSTGSYASNHNFIGLSINYIFTASNKRLRILSQENSRAERGALFNN